MSEVTFPARVVLRTFQQHVRYGEWYPTSWARWLVLTTQQVAMRCVAVAYSQSAQSNFLASASAKARWPVAKERFQLSELVTSHGIPAALPLAAHMSAYSRVEVPSREGETSRAWRCGRTPRRSISELVTGDADVARNPAELDSLAGTVQGA